MNANIGIALILSFCTIIFKLLETHDDNDIRLL